MKNSYFWGKNTHDMLNIDILTFNLFEEKTYIVSQGNGYCVIVDPGCSNEAERQTLIKALTDKSLTPTAVLLTHGHLDHIYGAAFIQKTYRDIPVYLNPADIKVMELTGAMAQKFHMEAPEIGFKTTDIHDKDTLSAAGISFNVIATPGHSPGGVCYYIQDECVLFSGDTLFAGAIGRTDLGYGEYDDEIRSIMEKIILLDPSVKVYPGHGPATTIGNERTGNPFLEPFNEPEEEFNPDAEPVVIHGNQ